MKIRFSIRDMFWLVLVAALAFGWWLDHKSLVWYRQGYRDAINREKINYGPLAK